MENKIDMSGNVNFIGTQEEWDALVEKNKLRLKAMKKQTAVQWLEEIIECGADLDLIKKCIAKAKAIEKEQIMEAYDLGSLSEMQYPDPKTVIENGEQYYTETYGK